MRRILCCFLSALLLFTFAGCSFLPIEPTDSELNKTVSSSDKTTNSKAETNSSVSTNTESNDPQPDPSKPRDILKIPISQLLQDEQKALAEYLFEKYIPCSFGLFSDAKDLSSPAVWSSIEALNRTVDGDESEDSRKLENVLKKIEIYYPETPFDPTKVRVYDAVTETFAPSPADTQEYEMISYEVKDDQITVYYQNKPDENDPDADTQQYATTLKNSKTKGYFSFVSSVKSETVG